MRFIERLGQHFSGLIHRERLVTQKPESWAENRERVLRTSLMMLKDARLCGDETAVKAWEIITRGVYGDLREIGSVSLPQSARDVMFDCCTRNCESTYE